MSIFSPIVKRPFVGRVEEQNRFRLLLQALSETDFLPHVVLLCGEAGIGKSALAARFGEMAVSELASVYGKVPRVIQIDWAQEVKGLHLSAPRRDGERRQQDEIGALWALVRLYRAFFGEQEFEEGGVADQALWSDKGFEWSSLISQYEAALSSGKNLKIASVQSLPKDEVKNRCISALAQGLKEVAAERPLVVMLDGYERIAQVDGWLRDVMKGAGGRVLWVLLSRENVAQDRVWGEQYVRGLAADFPRQLHLFMLSRLADEDIRRYWAAYLPKRPLDEAMLARISRLTRGVPLAVCLAADMWRAAPSAESLTTAGVARFLRQPLTEAFTERYLKDGITNEFDRRALYMLALTGGDETLLTVLLGKQDATFDLASFLSALSERYPAFFESTGKLQPVVADLLETELRTSLRKSSWVPALVKQIAVILQDKMAALEKDLPLLEARLQDEAWCQGVLSQSDYLFWLDEEAGWRWLMPHFVGSSVYNISFQRRLLQVAETWRSQMSHRNKSRLRILRKAFLAAPLSVEQNELLTELEQLAQKGWLAGKHEPEYRAILAWHRGQFFFQRKEYDRARRSYEQVERRLPAQGKQLKQLLGEGLYMLVDMLIWPPNQKSAVYSETAARLLPKVLTYLPQKAEAWRMWGLLLDHTDQYEKALEAYQRAITLEPTNSAVFNGLGEVYRALGRLDEALKSYQTAIQLDPTFAYAYNGLGNVYDDLERYAEAVDAYQRASQLDVYFVYPHHNLGNVYYTLGRYEEAIAAYQEAIRLDPSNTHPYNGLGVVYRKLKRYDEAIDAYQQAIRLTPSFAYPYYNLGNLHRHFGHFDDALDAYQKAITRDPQNAHFYHGLGKVYNDLGRYEEAMIAFQKAIALDKSDIYPQNSLANVYRILGRHEEALVAYQQALSVVPEDPFTYNGLGNVYRDLGRYEEAIDAYQKAIHIDPTYAVPHNGLGKLYYTTKAYDKAVASYRKTIALNPEIAPPYNNLAEIYMLQGRLDEAEAALQKRIDLMPQNIFTPLVIRGMIAMLRGEPSDSYFQKALLLWDAALQYRLQQVPELLIDKSLALLGVGKTEAALLTLQQVLAKQSEKIPLDVERYRLLRDAPQPPAGLEEMLRLLGEE